MSYKRDSISVTGKEFDNLPQKLKRVEYKKLKNLQDLTISFEGKNITGIFGANGAGKTTVLHSLACIYQPDPRVISTDYKFPLFFVPTTLSNWKDSEFTIHYDVCYGKTWYSRTKVYKKALDRWTPRKDKKPYRTVTYIGIDTCIPDMEQEIRKSNISLTKKSFGNLENSEKIKSALSFIMNRRYDDLSAYQHKRKFYTGLEYNGVPYPSLYMGAGEQRLIRILERVYEAPKNSLILIEELELTFHTNALLRLLSILSKISNKRGLQIVFTSHKEELLKSELINVRYLLPTSNGKQMFCLEQPNADCVNNLTGSMPRELTIFVEDILAESLVRRILEKNKMEPYAKVKCFGSSENAYKLACGIIINDENLENILIVLDGDVDRRAEDKEKKIASNLTGALENKEEKVRTLLTMIKQFHLPEGTKPEKFISDELKELDDDESSLIPFIKNVNYCNNSHAYLSEPIRKSGKNKEIAFSDIARMMSGRPVWTDYVFEINEWVANRKTALGFN